MASNSGRKSGSSGRSSSRKRVVIGAEETTRVRYSRDKPEVESERRKTVRQSKRDSSPRATAASKMHQAGRRMANEKRDERDRRKRSITRRRMVAAVAAALALAAVAWGLIALWSAPLFPVKEVQVAGASRLTTESVLASAGIPAGATLPKLPKRQILDRLRENPWVAEASLSRALPGTVRIVIVERKPIALVDAGGAELWLISSDGHWLSRRSAEDTTAVPTIREAPGAVPQAGVVTGSRELKNALAVVAGLSTDLLARVITVSAPTVDKTSLTLTENIQVFIGESADIAKKDRLVRKILSTEKKLVYINVRVVDRPTWRGLDSEN